MRLWCKEIRREKYYYVRRNPCGSDSCRIRDRSIFYVNPRQLHKISLWYIQGISGNVFRKFRLYITISFSKRATTVIMILFGRKKKERGVDKNRAPFNVLIPQSRFSPGLLSPRAPAICIMKCKFREARRKARAYSRPPAPCGSSNGIACPFDRWWKRAFTFTPWRSLGESLGLRRAESRICTWTALSALATSFDHARVSSERTARRTYDPRHDY